jgi:membrane fusion protein, multidrug efflux system
MAMKQLSRTSLSWYAMVVALSLLLIWTSGCTEVKSASQQETSGTPAVSVTVMNVNPRTIPIYNEFTGTTDATETVEVRARVNGYIEKRLFDAGQLVKLNQLLFVLDQRTYRADLRKAKANVTKAEADLRFAKEGVEVLRAESRLAASKAALVKADKDVARYGPLVRQQAAPKIDLDASLAQQEVLREEVNARKAELDQTKLQQRTQIALAAAELEAAQATQHLAELDLEYTEIRAPVNGRIGESNIFVGGLATANSAQPLTLLSPLDPIQVKVRIGERDYLNYIQKARDEEGRGRKAAEFSFQLLLGDGSAYRYPGRFRSADRAVDPQTGTLEITLDFPNPDLGLLPGTFSRVRVQTGEKSGVFLVPQRAVRDLQGVRTLYLVDKDDKVAARTVTTADRLGNLWVIEKGLEAGDRVIVEGIQRVQPGVKVQYKVEPEPQLEQATRSAAQ